MKVGIESLNLYGGMTSLDVRTLFQARKLNMDRFENLMMAQKGVALPCEDSVSNGVNAAKPIIDQLSDKERNRIEMVIACSESGLDFGKAMSTYFHDYLNLNRSCRLFEVKQACFAGTAALQMAINTIASGASPGGKVLVVATDMARAASRLSYAEPSQGTGAVAILVSDQPHILEIDFGANGLYGQEVMDTCRPQPDMETGDPDLSLLSYLEALEHCWRNYESKVDGAHFTETFDYLGFHTPFGGMVKGAHRKLMRKLYRAKGPVIDEDFQRRVSPSLHYCMQVGNVYSATLYFALCGIIDRANLQGPQRIGLFSYGSGCSAEFFSGLTTDQSQARMEKMEIGRKLADRYCLNMEEYDHLLDLSMEWRFGLKDKEVDFGAISHIYRSHLEGKGLLLLKKIDNFHREYVWT